MIPRQAEQRGAPNASSGTPPVGADALWDDAAVRSRDGHVLQSMAWGEVKRGERWTAQALRIGDPLPVANVHWRALPLGQRFAYVPRGPIFDHDDPEQLDAALAALADLARRRGAIFLKVDPEIPVERADLVAAYARHGFVRSAQDVQIVLATLEIDLRRGEDAILAGFDKDTRWSVRTAERRGVVVEARSDDEALHAFAALYGETGRRAGFITRPSRYYLRAWRTLLDAGHGTVYAATFEGAVVAAAMILWCGDRAVYMYGAGGASARRVYAAYALQWHAIRAAGERGCGRYDLGGIPQQPTPDDPRYGVYLFKRGFGGRVVTLAGAYDVAPRPVLYRAWLATEPRAYSALARLNRLRAR